MKRHQYWGLLFVSPFIVSLAVLTFYPFGFSAYLSFTRWNLFDPPRFVGLAYWKEVLTDPVFWGAVRNTFYFAAVFVPLQTGLALILAFLLNRRMHFRNLFRAIYFLPVVTPWVASTMVWRVLYSEQYGVINYVLNLFGLPGSKWMESTHWWVTIAALAFIQVWKGTGESMVLLLAGMQNVSRDVVEAALVDGASQRQIFSRIIVPLTSPMIFFVMILSSIAAFTAFDVFYTTFSVFSVHDRNLVMNLKIYIDAFLRTRFGPASVQAWALFLIILGITLFQKWFEKKWVHYEND